MAHEAVGQTLQPTALVHEAWLRLAGSGTERWHNRGHVFVGLSLPEAARALHLLESTAKRHWTFARAWLFHELAER
jgi:hypothetical protein